MRAFLTYLTTLLLLLALLLTPADAIWGKRKPKQQKEAQQQPKSGRDSAALGLEAFQELFQDPAALQDLMAMQRDPEVMREVEALMDDPEFQQYMEEYMNSPEVKQSLQMAEQLANDPEALAKFQSQLAEALGGGQEYTGKDNAQMGLDTLAQTVRDPAAMTQAMEMLSDPSIAAEVEAMMKDPAFQAEMRRITNSPLFKDALEQAKEMTAELQADPAKMQQFMQDLQKEMGNFAAAAAGGNKAGGRVGAGGRAEL